VECDASGGKCRDVDVGAEVCGGGDGGVVDIAKRVVRECVTRDWPVTSILFSPCGRGEVKACGDETAETHVCFFQ
jgi:hypothetical protein